MSKPCYYCGTEVTRSKNKKEHIPPQMMFRAFKFTGVTVPSCKACNESKSSQDQAIISGFMQSLDEMLKNGVRFTPNIRKAIQHNSTETFKTTKNTVERRELVKGLPRLAFIKYPTLNWIRQMTAGWVYDGVDGFDASIEWETTEVHSHSWYPPEFEGLNNIEIAEQAQMLGQITVDRWERGIRWENGWSPYPGDIYRFFVSFDDATTLGFKHSFYDSFIWYVRFECSTHTRENIRNKVPKTFFVR
jgi:hypothetical protein